MKEYHRKENRKSKLLVRTYFIIYNINAVYLQKSLSHLLCCAWPTLCVLDADDKQYVALPEETITNNNIFNEKNNLYACRSLYDGMCGLCAKDNLCVYRKDRSCPEGLAQGETLSSVSGRQIA